jgi:hypothetical protein
MSSHTLLFAITLLPAAALAWISVSSPRSLGIRLTALCITVLFVPLAYASFAELLGRPKPIGLDALTRQEGTAVILASLLEEDVRIYVWLQLQDGPEPRAYALPWSRAAAEQLQGASEQAARQATALRMRLPFNGTPDAREPLFYAEPQPAASPKEVPPMPLTVHAG